VNFPVCTAGVEQPQRAATWALCTYAAFASRVNLLSFAWQALNNLGVLHRERGNLERAAQCYTAALQIRPNFPQARTGSSGVCNPAAALLWPLCCQVACAGKLRGEVNVVMPHTWLMFAADAAGPQQPGGGVHGTGPRGRSPAAAARCVFHSFSKALDSVQALPERDCAVPSRSCAEQRPEDVSDS